MKKNFCLLLLVFWTGILWSNPYREFEPKVFELKITPFEREVLADSIPLFTQALIASGIPHAAFEKYMKAYEELKGRVLREVREKEPYQKADALLQWLHEKYFKEYREKITGFNHLMDKGIFNCVSSSLLYNLLLSEMNVSTRGALLSDHVLSQVRVGNEWIDSETTVAFGFDAGARKEAMDKFKKVTGFVYVPSSRKGRKVKFIPNQYFIALIYSNEGVSFLENKNYGTALDSFYKAMMIYPEFEEGEKNLQAAYTQYAIYLIDSKQFETGEKVLKESLELFPEFQKSRYNLKVLYLNWVNDLFSTGNYRKGISLMEEHAVHFNNEERRRYYLLWAQDLMRKQGKYLEALEVMRKAAEKFPDSREVTRYERYISQQYLSFLRERGLEKEAEAHLESLKGEDAEILFFRGIEYSKMGRIEKAQKLLFQSLEKKKDLNTVKALMQSAYDALKQYEKPQMTVEITRNLIPYTKNFGILRTHYNQVFSLLAQYFFKKNQTGRGVVLLQEFFRYPETEKQSAEAAAKLYYQTEVYPLLKNQELEKAIPRIEKGLALTGNRQTVLMDVYKNTLINYGVEEYRKKNLQRAYGVYKKLLPLFPKDAIVRKNFLAVGGAFLQSLKNNQPGEYNKVAKEIREMREKYRF